jgi:hypothetical protein
MVITPNMHHIKHCIQSRRARCCEGKPDGSDGVGWVALDAIIVHESMSTTSSVCHIERGCQSMAHSSYRQVYMGIIVGGCMDNFSAQNCRSIMPRTTAQELRSQYPRSLPESSKCINSRH